jgi:hypothetical protein
VIGIVVVLAVLGFAARAVLVPSLSGSTTPSPAEAQLNALQTGRR